MSNILLSSPVVWLYLLYVAALVVICFWPRSAHPPGPQEDDTPASEPPGDNG